MRLTPMASSSCHSARLENLRKFLKDNHYDGIIVPREDCFQGEYVKPSEERLAWLSGFTGSAGFAVVFLKKACLFVDGRYTLQAEEQVDSSLFQVCKLSKEDIRAWLTESFPAEGRILYDPWLHTVQQFKEWKLLIAELGGSLYACSENPIDCLWQDKPPSPLVPIVPHPLQWSGQESLEKRQRVSRVLEGIDADVLVLTSPESIAWLLNIRGGDVRYTPVCHAFLILRSDATVDVFVDLEKVTNEIRDYCGRAVCWKPEGTFLGELSLLSEQSVFLDPKQVPQKVYDTLRQAEAKVIYGDDPCLIMRAVKNTTELKGAYAAHQRDGAAMVNFLAWLEKNVLEMEITEIDAAKHLEAQRRGQPHCHDLSFPSISSWGPHGAVVHYRPTLQTNSRLCPNSLYLIDSGGQYLDGTTDITRTIVIGAPTDEQKDRYTRVLRGHIALAAAIFPVGTVGTHLDILARQYLWQVGLDFDHGTGHGVGSYLNVHEGPQRVSKAISFTPLQPGMILSNEPGYYKPGEYGIRLENLVTVITAVVEGDRDMLAFDTLTLVPYDKNLINVWQLSPAEKDWVDSYHQRVWANLSSLVDQGSVDWLKNATDPLKNELS